MNNCGEICVRCDKNSEGSGMKRVLFFVLTLFLFQNSICLAQDYDQMVTEFGNDFPNLSDISTIIANGKDDVFPKPLIVLEYIKKGECEKAFSWLNEIRRLDQSEYFEMLGIMYANGDCVEKDLRISTGYLRRSGTTSSKLDLLWIYVFNKQGLPFVTPREAFEISNTSANEGSYIGAAQLAYSYLYGEGTIKDLKEAYKWFLIAIAMSPNDGIRGALNSDADKVESVLSSQDSESMRDEARKKFDSIKATKSAYRPSVVSFIYAVRPQ